MSQIKQQIVIAWVTESAEVISTAHIDIGETPKTKAVKVPKAVVWRRAGNEEDLKTAQSWAQVESSGDEVFRKVFVYPSSERDPLSRAKAEILTAVPDDLQAKYQSILLLSADIPEQLRPGDVDRVMEEAGNQSCLEGFQSWLLNFKLSDRTRANIESWELEG